MKDVSIRNIYTWYYKDHIKMKVLEDINELVNNFTSYLDEPKYFDEKIEEIYNSLNLIITNC